MLLFFFIQVAIYNIYPMLHLERSAEHSWMQYTLFTYF